MKYILTLSLLFNAAFAVAMEGEWNIGAKTIYGLIGCSPQHREKDIERARKKLRYYLESHLASPDGQVNNEVQERLDWVREISSVLESNSQRELYNDFLISLKVFDLSLSPGAGFLHLKMFKKFAQWLKSDDQQDAVTQTSQSIRALFQKFLSEPVNGYRASYSSDYLEHMWDWLEKEDPTTWFRRMRHIFLRPEVVIGSACALSILSFAAGRFWDQESPPAGMIRPVEQRIEESRQAPIRETSSEDAADAIGTLLKPDLK